MTRINGINLSLKRGMQQILENGSSNRARAFGGANQGDRIREKQCIQTSLRAVLCVLVHAGRGPILNGLIIAVLYRSGFASLAETSE